MARNIEELNDAIASLTKQLAKVRKALKVYETEADDAGAATEKVGNKARTTAIHFKDGKQQIEGFGAAMRSVGGHLGPVEDMATAVEKLGPAGLAAATGVAALVGAAFAVAEFARVTVEATRAAGELLDEWDTPHIFADQADAIADANEALDGLVFAGQQLQILFAAGMSPAVVETVDTVLAFGLAVADVVETAERWGITLSNVSSTIYELTALLGPLGYIGQQVFENIGAAAGWVTDRYRDQAEALRETGLALNDTEHAFDRAADAMAGYLDAADGEFDMLRLTDAERARIDEEDRKRRERRAREEEKARKARAAADEKAREEALKAEEEYWEAWRLESEKAIEDKAKAEQDAAEEAQRLYDEQTASIQAAAEAEAEAVAAAIEVEKRGREELAAASIGLADTLLAAVQDNANTETAEGRRTARQVFGARKALALADVAIATIVAVQQALASAPPPFNAIPAAAMGVTGAANLAAVAAQKPPSFAIGGLVPSDHQLIGAQAGEGILSTAAVRALGEQQVGAMNRGTAGGAPVEVAMVYRHRVFDRFVQDNLRRSDSPLAGAIQGARRKRKRRR